MDNLSAFISLHQSFVIDHLKSYKYCFGLISFSVMFFGAGYYVQAPLLTFFGTILSAISIYCIASKIKIAQDYVEENISPKGTFLFGGIGFIYCTVVFAASSAYVIELAKVA